MHFYFVLNLSFQVLYQSVPTLQIVGYKISTVQHHLVSVKIIGPDDVGVLILLLRKGRRENELLHVRIDCFSIIDLT